MSKQSAPQQFTLHQTGATPLVSRRAGLVEEARRRMDEEEHRERERLANLEKARLDGLFAAANDWRRAANLRAFVEAVVAASGESTPAAIERLERWASEALSAADRLDPLRRGQFPFQGLPERRLDPT